MAEKGKAQLKLPVMGYKEIDIWEFWSEVMAHGGYSSVTKTVGTWSKIWKKLSNYDPSITDASFRLKKNYERYLLDFEYTLFPERKENIESSASEGDSNAKENTKRKNRKRVNSSAPKEIQRDLNGEPLLPIVLGELTIENLGEIIHHPPWTTDKYIWPLHFRSSRYFYSMFQQDKRVKYTSEILNVGEKPYFRVTPSDDMENPITSSTPSGAWRIILQKIRNKNPNFISDENSAKNISVSGRVRFGLAHPVICSLLQEKVKPSILSENTPTPIQSQGKKRKDLANSIASNPQKKYIKFQDSFNQLIIPEMEENAVTALLSLKMAETF